MQYIDLGGTWLLTQKHQEGADKRYREEVKESYEFEDAVPVNVPGTVLSGLLQAGRIEDPYFRMNEYEITELFYYDYVFTRKFYVPEEVCNEENVELICEGLDTIAEVSLNGVIIGYANNMHRTWDFNAKRSIHPGENEISVHFRSVLRYIDDYVYEPGKEVKFINTGSMKGAQLVRKAHCMFGWDWGPQLVDAGIFRKIGLKCWTGPQMREVYLRQHHDGGKVTLSVYTDLTEFPGEDKEYEIRILDENGKEAAHILKNCDPTDLGIYDTMEIEDPHLWWPAGMGEQPLYDVCVRLMQKGKVLSEETGKIGLRTLTVSRDKDQYGEEFAMTANGIKFFAKGANYVPEDCMLTTITPERQRYLLESCKRSNFNCVRVWGGGYYFSDEFYDICDELGLVVWQDLMFACNVYDFNDRFAANIYDEIQQNVKRLRHHACIGLWCGNNELEGAWVGWGEFQKETAYLRADYIKMFEQLVPDAVRKADKDTFFWPSSPSSGGCFDDPNDENRGDMHYWEVWHSKAPFSAYRDHTYRFFSEFGFQSYPGLKTVSSYTLPEDRNPFSEVMDSHEKDSNANEKFMNYFYQYFLYPKDFESFLYVTQILQALAIKTAVDHCRRNYGRCMGAVYWQFNDNWPVASWSSIDYFGRWKMLQYAAKRFFAPVAQSILLNDKTADVYLVNDRLEEQKYSAKLSVRSLDNKELWSIRRSGRIGERSAMKILSQELTAALAGLDEREVYLLSEVKIAEEHLQEVETLKPYKYLKLRDPKLQVKISEKTESFEIELSTEAFAPYVWLDMEHADGIFSDNMLYLTEQKTKVTLEKKDLFAKDRELTLEDLKRELTVKTLQDSYVFAD